MVAPFHAHGSLPGRMLCRRHARVVQREMRSLARDRVCHVAAKPGMRSEHVAGRTLIMRTYRTRRGQNKSDVGEAETPKWRLKMSLGIRAT